MGRILNTESMPEDAIERIIWLDGVKAAVANDLERLYEDAYFEARLTGRLDAALKVGVSSRKRVLAWTRKGNERRGRSIRWSDGCDPTSTAYRPPA